MRALSFLGFYMLDINALIALLMLLAVVFGGIMKILWVKVNGLDQRLSDERVKSAERFVTVDELDRRLEQSLKPVTNRLDHMEVQNDRILQLLMNQAEGRGAHREVASNG